MKNEERSIQFRADDFQLIQQDTRIMPPLHPESITAKFGDLQFGKNYNPKQ